MLKDGSHRRYSLFPPCLFLLVICRGVLKHVNLCSLYFLLFISMLAVVNDMNSTKIKNLESCVPRFG